MVILTRRYRRPHISPVSSRLTPPVDVALVYVHLSDGEPTADGSGAAELHPSELEHGRKADRTSVREMKVLTVPEFDSIPQ